jgi:hypothetical protein
VQNVGSGFYHLTLAENLRPSDWTSFEAITVAGMKVVKENRAFRAYDVQLSDGAIPGFIAKFALTRRRGERVRLAGIAVRRRCRIARR